MRVGTRRPSIANANHTGMTGSGARYSVVFHRGYTARTMEFVIDSVAVTTAKNDLNLPRVWEIKLGMRVK